VISYTYENEKWGCPLTSPVPSWVEDPYEVGFQLQLRIIGMISASRVRRTLK